MVSISNLGVFLSLVAFAIAVPHNPRQAAPPPAALCKPKFMGKPVSLIAFDLNGELGSKKGEVQIVPNPVLASISKPEFFVLPAGQHKETYNIRVAKNPKVMVTLSNGKLLLAQEQQGSTAQQFNVDCLQCTEEGFGVACKVSDPSTGKCAIVSDDNTHLEFGSCEKREYFHLIQGLKQ